MLDIKLKVKKKTVGLNNAFTERRELIQATKVALKVAPKVALLELKVALKGALKLVLKVGQKLALNVAEDL